jgi:hypothetical protein
MVVVLEGCGRSGGDHRRMVGVGTGLQLNAGIMLQSLGKACACSLAPLSNNITIHIFMY